MHKRNEAATGGEIVVLRETDAGTSVSWHECLDRAFEEFQRNALIQEWEDLDELLYEMCWRGEATVTELDIAAEAVSMAGIADDEPFIAFNPHDPHNVGIHKFYPLDYPKERLFQEIIGYDTRNAEWHEMASGETYGAFIDRVLASTQCSSLKAKDLYEKLNVDQF